MRSYGRNPTTKKWEIITDANLIWLATLIQTCRLSLRESPVYSQLGIDGHGSVMKQVAPDLDVSRIQRYYAPRFTSLVVARVQTESQPTYSIDAVLKNGTRFTQRIVS